MSKQELKTNMEIKELKNSKSDFAESKKEDALKLFEETDYPKEKDEDWRYTFIEKVKLEKFSPFEGNLKIEASQIPEELIKQGVVFTDINSALQKYPAAQNHFGKSLKHDKLSLLNSSYFSSGFFLYVPKNIELKGSLRAVVSLSDKSIIRNLVVVESNSSVDIVEEIFDFGENEKLNSSVTEVFSLNNSRVNYYHSNNYSKNTFSFAQLNGTLERNANINWISSCFGGKLNRLRIETFLNGDGSNSNNLGIFLGRNKEHIDFTTNVSHNALNTTNDIMVDGILKDESSSVYRGLILIAKEGQKTNSYLSNHILKLGDKTLANSIPGLKIDANDVKASHGATVGQVNEEHMFYLMARGLSRKEAENLIVEGFFEPIIQKIPLEEIREKIRVAVRG